MTILENFLGTKGALSVILTELHRIHLGVLVTTLDCLLRTEGARPFFALLTEPHDGCRTHLDVLVTILESLLGTEGAFFALLTKRRTQFLTPSTELNSLRGSRDHGFVLFISRADIAIARPT